MAAAKKRACSRKKVASRPGIRRISSNACSKVLRAGLRSTAGRAVAGLETRQNADGGWGEDMRSYDDQSLAGRGASTASQTAWALLALLAAGSAGPAVDAGVRWLAEHQRSDGTWDEPQFTGTGFPRDFYINYHLYRLVFPVSALGRYLAETA